MKYRIDLTENQLQLINSIASLIATPDGECMLDETRTILDKIQGLRQFAPLEVIEEVCEAVSNALCNDDSAFETMDSAGEASLEEYQDKYTQEQIDQLVEFAITQA